MIFFVNLDLDKFSQMLPFGGQGSNSAIEDAGSLGYLFSGVDDAESVTERLRLFEHARKARASRIQVLSSVRAGKEKEVEEELRRYADPPGSSKRHIPSLAFFADIERYLSIDCLNRRSNKHDRTHHPRL